MPSAADNLKALRSSLKKPITSLQVLRDLLISGLEPIRLLPLSTNRGLPRSSQESESFSDADILAVEKFIPGCQLALLEQVLPIWTESVEDDQEARVLLRQYFSPVRSRIHGQDLIRSYFAISAYQTLSTALISKETKGPTFESVVSLLVHLAEDYSLVDVYRSIFVSQHGSMGQNESEPESKDVEQGHGRKAKESLLWSEAIKSLTGLPIKLANAIGRMEVDSGRRGVVKLPRSLEARPYFDRLCIDYESLMFEMGRKSGYDIQPMQALLLKLHGQGLLQPPQPMDPSSRSPALLSPIMPQVLAHLHSISGNRVYPTDFWPTLLSGLPSPAFIAFLWSFLLHLSKDMVIPTGFKPAPTPTVKVAARYLEAILGTPDVKSPLWQTIVSQLILPRAKGREESKGQEFRVRVFVCWISAGGEGAVQRFLDELVVVWTDAAEIKFSSFARLTYLTHLLILTTSLLPPGHPALIKLAFYSPLLLSIQSFLSHSDNATRRLGMLVAELLSQTTVVESPEAIRERQEKELKVLNKGRSRASGQSKDEMEQEIQELIGKMAIGGDNPDDALKTGKSSTTSKAETGGGIETKVKKLDFGKSVWDGVGEGREECRYLRSFVGLQDKLAVVRDDSSDWMLGWAQPSFEGENLKDPSPTLNDPKPKLVGSKDRGKKVEPMDSDDESLVGYSSSSAASSRAPSPTPSYLEEVANDPMLNTSTRPKVERPVYIVQLIELFRAREEPDKVEVGLKWGETLVRRKRDFGTELEENAVELTTMLLALNDNFELDSFETKRQAILIAVTACVPKLVAPFMIEQYFNNQYSLVQRSAILTALAMSARETAGLDTPTKPDMARIDFPSKMLPSALHKKYISATDSRLSGAPGLIEATLAGISNDVLKSSRDDIAREVPSLVRERQLRMKKPAQSKTISEIGPSRNGFNLSAPSRQNVHQPVFPYREIAAEFYILPLINRFWDHFESEMTREARGKAGYRAAGTAMILSPLSMAKYLSTLSIMIHAARHSPAFLSVIAPEALTLTVAVGSKLTVSPDHGHGGAVSDDQPEFEADVIGSALELALVVLDASKDIDGGRTLATDGSTALMATSDWAGQLFEAEAKGQATAGSAGGLSEGRTRKAAAGVVMLVAGIVEQMRHLLGWSG